MSKHTKTLSDLSPTATVNNDRQSPQGDLTNTTTLPPLTANTDNSAMVKNSSTSPDNSPKTSTENTKKSPPAAATTAASSVGKTSSSPIIKPQGPPPTEATKKSPPAAATIATSPMEKTSSSPIIKPPEEIWPYFPDWEGDLHSEYINSLPNICGSERLLETTLSTNQNQPIFSPESHFDFEKIRSACAIALHMHQPLTPAGGGDLKTAEIISNLRYMMENQYIGDNYNAPVFHWCYKRIGEFIPQLVNEGKQPRVMLEYSGTLFHGLRHMGLHDVFDNLKTITCDHNYRRTVEWLGCPWGHAVAPSTPVQDYRLHVRAWQHHFAAIFGAEALSRVRGFSPSEMALPNHPDVAYEFVKTLNDCGYQWVLVQEHSIERPENGHGPELPHLPQVLKCTNSRGETAQIIAIIKTQGSDTKLVAQMQPYYEARGLSRWEESSRWKLAGKPVPPLVTQIADGENGGVMMNEFPHKFFEVANDCSNSDVPMVNVTEYLEHLFAMGIQVKDFPIVQPIMQKRIWDRFNPGDGPEKLAKTIEALRQEDGQFHMEGGSWTNNISWVKGYENIIGPMEKVSLLFHEKIFQGRVPSNEHRYRNALFHLMVSQTSCYRYWGQGLWTDYGQEVCRRTHDILVYDF